MDIHNFERGLMEAALPESSATPTRLLLVGGVAAMQAYGTVVPTDGTAGYLTGCLFAHTDGGAGTSLYVNEGSATSCDFNALAGA